jgi:aryl-alcohol dehydrogenase-like predicted oxidoreductase
MRYRQLGSSDLQVSEISLGSWLTYGGGVDGSQAEACVAKAFEVGINFIDTANVYAGGRAEEFLGQVLADRQRDSYVLATKVFFPMSDSDRGLSAEQIHKQIDASLERLQTDHIDLLYFHDDDLSVPLEDSLATVEWLIESGKVRYLGASNFSADRLIEARILSSTGLPKFIAIEPHYNLVHRAGFESDLRIVASAQGLAVMPCYALANGFLTGKYRTKDDLKAGARSVRAAEYVNRRGQRVLSVLDRVAREHESSVASIALAWLLAKRSIVAPVASASRPEQVEALMAAAAIRLTRAQMLELDRVSE